MVAFLSHAVQGALGPRHPACLDRGHWRLGGKDEGICWMKDMGRGSRQGSLCSGDMGSGDERGRLGSGKFSRSLHCWFRC